MQPTTTVTKPTIVTRLLMPVGILLATAGAIGYTSDGLPQASLTSLIVATPASGMVATSVGNGGAAPTHVDPGTNGLTAIRTLGYVPTTPAEYLRPRTKTLNGAADGSSPALWKVWWDGRTQVKAAVSLQQSLKAVDAEQGLTETSHALGTQNPNTSAITIPGLPGAFAYLWEGSEVTGTGAVAYQVWAALFCRSTEIALVSMKSYGAGNGVAGTMFFAFARAQYAAMKAAGPSSLLKVSLGVVSVMGIAMFFVGYARHRKRAMAPASGIGPSRPSPTAPQFALPPPGWYPDPHMPAAQSGLRYWDGASWTTFVMPRPTDIRSTHTSGAPPPSG